MIYTFCSEVIPNLFLGSVEASENFEFIDNKDISVIVNCSKDISNKFSLNLLKPIEEAPNEVQKWLYDNSYYIKYYRIPVDDSGKDIDLEDFYKYTLEILDLVKADYDSGKNILVHCLAGCQRSASFVCAFIMLYKKISLDKSIQYLLEKKPNVFFFGNHINFEGPLKKLEQIILKNQ